jgi:hypothetical protein
MDARLGTVNTFLRGPQDLNTHHHCLYLQNEDTLQDIFKAGLELEFEELPEVPTILAGDTRTEELKGPDVA